MERRKFVIGLGALASGSAAAVGSGAFSAAQIDGREADIAVNGDDAALIQLIPGHFDESDGGAGGDSTVSNNRVYLDNGQLTIDFESDSQDGNGINPNSVYQVGSIGEDANRFDNKYTGIDEDDVLYGDKSTSEDPAFFLANESDETYTVEIEWQGNAPSDNAGVDQGDAAAAFVSDGVDADQVSGDPDAAGFVLGLDSGGDSLSRFEMGPGDSVGMSLIAVVGDVDPSGLSDPEGWEGELVIRAGENTGSV